MHLETCVEQCRATGKCNIFLCRYMGRAKIAETWCVGERWPSGLLWTCPTPTNKMGVSILRRLKQKNYWCAAKRAAAASLLVASSFSERLLSPINLRSGKRSGKLFIR